MPASWPILLIVGLWLFAIGTVVGSFLNVCIYRLPWQKSVIWPGSHCPRCFQAIAPRDNIPIVGWIVLGGRCRNCSCRISSRYPMLEGLVGVFFAALFVIDVILGPRSWAGEIPLSHFAAWSYHVLLVALLVAATFIDYDLTIIPDEVTVTGMVLGIAIGTWLPWVRPMPGTAATHASGFWTGIVGLLAGGGLTQFVRVSGSLALRRDAMGFGDVTLMAMIGSFLGWQAAVLTFFLAPFFGLAHAFWKIVKYVGKRLAGVQVSSADREIPFGPYLSMAAVALVISWRWLWPHWAKNFFDTFGMVLLWLLGLEK